MHSQVHKGRHTHTHTQKTCVGQTGRTSGRRARRVDGLDTEDGGRGRGQPGGGWLVQPLAVAEPGRRLDFLLDVVPEPAAWNRHSAASGGRRVEPLAAAG